MDWKEANDLVVELIQAGMHETGDGTLEQLSRNRKDQPRVGASLQHRVPHDMSSENGGGKALHRWTWSLVLQTDKGAYSFPSRVLYG